MDKQYYKKLIDDGFLQSGEDDPMDYLCEWIFNISTYDSALSRIIAEKAVEVCLAISRSMTFEYISDPENYKWYIMMCNMPFFADRITWGCSIRGAWWDWHIRYSSCGLYDGDDQILDLEFIERQWFDFIEAISEFYNEHN